MKILSRRSQVSILSAKEIHSHHEHRQEQRDDHLWQEPRKYWEVSAHCETLPFPQPWPEVYFDNPGTNYHFQRLSACAVPDQQMAKHVTQAYHRVLVRLIQTQLQVKNFILPVQLMKMKYMDPFSRQRIIEELCKYFRLQTGLRSIVLEQAEVKFIDLCRLLVAIAENSRVKSLFLWHVLDPCDKPFQGALESEIILDDLPRIPYTYNPGGRKYLRDLKAKKGQHKQSMESSYKTMESEKVPKTKTRKSLISHVSSTRKISLDVHQDNAKSSHMLLQLGKLENMVKRCLHDPSTGDMTCKIIKKELVPTAPDIEEHVFSQAELGIQCTISQDEINVAEDAGHAHHSNIDDNKRETQHELEYRALKRARLVYCEQYLKYYKNTSVRIQILRDIYMIALGTLTNLTQLAVNYSLLADGTGNTLLSIGSLNNGRLRHLKLLCEPEEVPSPTHQVYNDHALQAIPDLIWHSVQQLCPEIKVHIVCVSMSAYEITKRFVTKNVPLNSFHMENGFCPTLTCPQLTIYSTLKCLWLDHAETLEHLHLSLWHTTGRIDSSLEKIILKTNLRSFVYSGPLQYKATVNKLCDAALQSPKIKFFKLMIQGDPCFPQSARELSNDLYLQYRHRFQEKSIHFVLGTFNF